MITVDGLEILGAIIYVGTTIPVVLFNYMKSLTDVEFNQEPPQLLSIINN